MAGGGGWGGEERQQGCYRVIKVASHSTLFSVYLLGVYNGINPCSASSASTAAFLFLLLFFIRIIIVTEMRLCKQYLIWPVSLYSPVFRKTLLKGKTFWNIIGAQRPVCTVTELIGKRSSFLTFIARKAQCQPLTESRSISVSCHYCVCVPFSVKGPLKTAHCWGWE